MKVTLEQKKVEPFLAEAQNIPNGTVVSLPGKENLLLCLGHDGHGVVWFAPLYTESGIMYPQLISLLNGDLVTVHKDYETELRITQWI